MRKLNSLILTTVLILSSLSGCGMSGPLYQEKEPTSATSPDTQDKQINADEQQE
ncbi:hypothetical protein tinsulaeT_17650 [Thalassotalea insulae]|uniref:Lipoprotein n=1 Tax=Thalassotalea insulae TaxID=2056778 RepID=A0ABQ6GUT3_9GAMM|nr:lipoprotein [Thalassotalea insulae]GLX78425.1 hypothetical protein tinsulaeT_17650 [Thalassotalea insulae]